MNTLHSFLARRSTEFDIVRDLTGSINGETENVVSDILCIEKGE